MSTSFSIQHDGPVATVTLVNRIDGESAPALAEALTRLIGSEVNRIVFMASELTFISSMGLRAIVFIKQKLGKDSAVYLIGAPPHVVEVFCLTGFDTFIHIQEEYVV
jgi:anti-anti-sigma factor